MMEREPPKSRLKVSMELDRISNLPSDFINKILSYLPIREAVRTSVLSSKWRNKSAMLTHLLFDDRCTSDQNPTTFAGIVDHVLLGHIGPIYRFAITHFRPQVGRDIDRWILHLSRNSIKELGLNISCGGHRYKMPSCFFSCQDLIHLVLYNCLLQPPSTFRGFRRVKNCGLFNVALDQDVFENLIVCCPLLERLKLTHCDGLTQFKIDAPNLKVLKFEGVLEDVSFVNTLKLANVRVCLTANVANDQRQTAGSCSNLLKFFVHLPRIQCLHVTNYFLKYLAVGVLPGRLLQPCLYMNFFSIHLDFNDPKEILTVLCLLRSFPALQVLEILARKKDQAVVGDVNYGLDNNQNCHLTKLRIVKITGISGVKAELDFIRLLLSSSPVLEKMIVKPATTNDFQLVNKLLQKLLQFKRVSENAKIFYVDP
ncbi:F-box/FBD/LRR-repeat protein At1g13570-like isoform X1 [Malus domestica]|uniref:F-box/FBD/LRR-repeat protein At1g13570-like isoform X1 n=2 Tax=Malus domestica TaxID=3750 RepID=UPI0039766006